MASAAGSACLGSAWVAAGSAWAGSAWVAEDSNWAGSEEADYWLAVAEAAGETDTQPADYPSKVHIALPAGSDHEGAMIATRVCLTATTLD